MPRKFIRKFLPDPHKIRDHKSIKMFGTLLHEPNLWHLNRRSIASAFAVGLFFMWIPVPFQMALAAGAAIIIRSNLPISVALVWISNPLTMPPMFYFAYLLGTWILGVNEMHFVFEPTMDWLKTEMLIIWKPFLTGCLTLAIVSSALGFTSIRLLWRLAVLRYLDKKKKNRR
ncbi:MAG: DUF2062 domain-containing protein [Gammaproteobacteria bacterium]|nr:DUF2062 domain-containing protein [Gammaproteobacteria bacterium]MCW8911424.1 DUF2062 domain-containing protein [Gammaproteobacteria bacterium]MCW9003997.1 DUF2062 domain-containing protein [Gammaproteobacteria bacterium]MCW9055705.1 DUF2062 domain-containing protein [Gammaproteobacteria bacterium]